MELTCPHCGFSREVPDDQLPDRPMRVVCPGCGERFPWRPAAPARPAVVPSASKTCPVCGLEQSSALACRGCGVIFARLAERRHQELPEPTSQPQPAPAAAADNHTVNDRPTPRQMAKAGFGLRFIAMLIDGLVFSVAVLLVALGLGGIIAHFGDANPQLMTMMVLLAIFVLLALSSLLQVFFIGYCGQTPGKMVTRIKVIRCSGAEVGFGAAIFREVIGKLISALLLGCGYLMVLFDEQHQGLHDKIADTYVVKL